MKKLLTVIVIGLALYGGWIIYSANTKTVDKISKSLKAAERVW